MNATAFAKINWDLRILGRREDRFHELDSIFVNVSLGDAMTFELHDSLELTCSDPSLPVDGANLVVKAARLLAAAAGCKDGARIHLEKAIPQGGGMGGGSSDAACTLALLNALWKLNWSREKLSALAAEVGSDVAYFLHGGWCLCTGRGENVARLPGSENWPPVKLLIVLPPLHVSTPLVYKALNAPEWNRQPGRNAGDAGKFLSAALQAGAPLNLELRNDLSEAARQVEPRLAAIQEVLQKYFPQRWLMSGSGASHFAVPPQEKPFENFEALYEELRVAMPGTRVLETHTIGGAS